MRRARMHTGLFDRAIATGSPCGVHRKWRPHNADQERVDVPAKAVRIDISGQEGLQDSPQLIGNLKADRGAIIRCSPSAARLRCWCTHRCFLHRSGTTSAWHRVTHRTSRLRRGHASSQQTRRWPGIRASSTWPRKHKEKKRQALAPQTRPSAFHRRG